MTKEELKTLIAETSKKAKEEAKEKGLSKEETKKYLDEAIAKVKAENPIQDEPKEKRYIVKTQVKNYNGIVAGVQFAYGKSAVELQEGWILNWFKEKGYIVEEVK